MIAYTFSWKKEILCIHNDNKGNQINDKYNLSPKINYTEVDKFEVFLKFSYNYVVNRYKKAG